MIKNEATKICIQMASAPCSVAIYEQFDGTKNNEAI